MLLGAREGFGLEFHLERDPHLLCVDVFVGGVLVNAWDNAFYPPLLVKKLADELGRLGGAVGEFEFLEWGECTDQVMATALPEGEWVRLACEVWEVDGDARSEVVVTVGRGEFAATLEHGLAVAEREWSARRAAAADST